MNCESLGGAGRRGKGRQAGQQLSLTAASDELVLFGDGVESDVVTLAWGQTARVGVAARAQPAAMNVRDECAAGPGPASPMTGVMGRS